MHELRNTLGVETKDGTDYGRLITTMRVVHAARLMSAPDFVFCRVDAHCSAGYTIGGIRKPRSLARQLCPPAAKSKRKKES